ncbi:MAG TPA: Clp protease N-terminal domain-containing protein [Gaiellaceae bacterium]|jgi:ATP-dependent Clp protease ATP-binding subunit ClpA|nr:Clp protease N-terminal domain-containing protein [Gaiellaceae bacterium]
MATLHVRNVPDGLYEALRRQAEANGRSIGAEAVQLLEKQLAIGLVHGRERRFVRSRRRRRGCGPFQRFTAPARAAVAAAQDEARTLRHDHVGTGHLLLGLLTAGESTASTVLETLGLTPERVRAELTERGVVGQEEPPARIPFEPGAKKALELALREALSLGDNYIGTEHLLLGIVREGDTAGAEIVRGVEADAEAVREAVVRAVEAEEEAAEARSLPPVVLGPAAEAEQEFRVVELEGSAADWQASLTGAAADGFELVEVVGARAIFRRG